MDRDQQGRTSRTSRAWAVGLVLPVSAALTSCSESSPHSNRLPGVVAASTSPAGAGSAGDGPAGPDPVTPAATVGPSGPAGPAAGSVLASLPAGAPAVASGVGRALAPHLSAEALGDDPGVVVLDPRSGAVLAGTDAAVGAVPASTAKLLVGTAVLDRWGAAHRFTTRVLDTGTRGGLAHLVLVGGGDPSLTAGTGSYPVGAGDAAVDPVADPARLSELVAQSAAALREAGTARVAVAVDDTLFAGPSTSPAWRSSYVSGGFVGPVDALSTDGGRVDADTITRVADPGLSAGRDFAAELAATGLTVVGAVTRDTAPTGDTVPTTAGTLAAVSSPRLVDLVRHMLLASDNDYAETLLRQVAPPATASFTGSVAAVLARLSGLGVPTAGVLLDDGSGLSRADRIPPLVLARVLAVDLRDPALAGVPRSLPVAGRTGTLADRFTGAAAIGAGRVFAKTGTLTGVDDLAGYVSTRGAGPLVVVVMADDTTDSGAAESAIDVLVAAVVRCGCHS